MNIRKSLIKFARNLESTWNEVDLKPAEQQGKPVAIRRGWYVSEFAIKDMLDRVPELRVQQTDNTVYKCIFDGAHTGHNRILFYLKEGQLIAYDSSIEFKFLSRISSLEARIRTFLISFRILVDFFSLKMLLRLIVIQFKRSSEFSASLSRFYALEKDFIDTLDRVEINLTIHPWVSRFIAWKYQSLKIAVLIESEQQRQALDKQIIKADYIVCAESDDVMPNDVDYFIVLKSTEQLHATSICWFKKTIFKSKHQLTMLYANHCYIELESNLDDTLQKEVMVKAALKPEPSLAYLYCSDYIGSSVAYAADVLKDINMKQLMSDTERYYFNIKLLSQAFKSQRPQTSVQRIDEVLFMSSRDGDAELSTPVSNSTHSCWQNIDWVRDSKKQYNQLLANNVQLSEPSVDLIIPTRDGLEILKPCIESILEKTSYKNYHIIIVDNGSELKETHDYFASLSKHSNVSIVAYPGEFNYSAINNFAISKGNSEYIALVNNDIEVIDGDWLTQMMAWAQQDSVGIVGAKLLYGNGDIQHAGVIIGMGNAAGHIHRTESGDSLGYQNRCVATQNMMAVTAACLVTPRNLFDQVGGLDDVNFKIAYNDIDYCLKIEKLGYELIWTPEACLYHHESVSRGDDMSDKHIDRYFKELSRFQKKWKAKGFADKYYSQYLRIGDEGVYPQRNQSGEDHLKFLND